MTSAAISLSRPVIFDTGPDIRFDKITQLASRFLNAPISLLTVIDDASDRQWFKSETGLPEELRRTRSTPLSHSFCRHVRDSGEPLIVKDASLHALLRNNPAIEEIGVVSYVGIPFHGETGQPLGALCCIHAAPREWTAEEIEMLTYLASIADDQVQFQVAIRDRAKAKLLAERAATTRASFVSHASHEVRTPLTNIFGAARLLNTLPLDKRAERLALVIERNSSQLMNLMDDMMHVSRLDAGAAILEEEAYDLVDVVGSVVEKNRDTAEAKNLALTLENALKGSTTLLLDRENLAGVIDRLVSNAVNFTSTGAVRVKIESEKPGSVAILVIDTGIGIDPAQQGVLFEEFERHDPRSARIGGGTGFGMNLVRRLAELMGGTITVVSQPGEGTTFTIRLPLHAEDEATAALGRNAETADHS